MIFSVFPIDTFVDKPLVRMEVVGEPSHVTAVQQEFLGIAQRGRDATYRWARSNALISIGASADVFAIVATGESRGYGNFVISKGGL